MRDHDCIPSQVSPGVPITCIIASFIDAAILSLPLDGADFAQGVAS
jgi:hypothetical protein